MERVLSSLGSCAKEVLITASLKWVLCSGATVDCLLVVILPFGLIYLLEASVLGSFSGVMAVFKRMDKSGLRGVSACTFFKALGVILVSMEAALLRLVNMTDAIVVIWGGSGNTKLPLSSGPNNSMSMAPGIVCLFVPERLTLQNLRTMSFCSGGKKVRTPLAAAEKSKEEIMMNLLLLLVLATKEQNGAQRAKTMCFAPIIMPTSGGLSPKCRKKMVKKGKTQKFPILWKKLNKLAMAKVLLMSHCLGALMAPA